MANLDLMSYERNSRWMPHLSWAHPNLNLQQRMDQQAAQRQAWQKIADKLGPLLIGSDIGGSYGQSDYISRDICEDQEYLSRAYEKAPLLSSAKYASNSQRQPNMNNNNNNNCIKNNNSNNTSRNTSYNVHDLLSQHDHQKIAAANPNYPQTRNNNGTTWGDQPASGRKNSNLNLYAQSHLIQMPQGRGQSQLKRNSYHGRSSHLCTILSVFTSMLLLLLFSLLLFFFYPNN